MIIFYYGQDDFRSRQKLKEIKNKFNKEVDPSGNSLDVFDGEKISIKEVANSLNAQSLLSRKRMVVVENIFLNKGKTICSEFCDYLEKTKAEKIDNIIIIWESVLVSGKTGKGALIDGAGKEKALTVSQKKLFEYLNKQKFTQEFKILSVTEFSNWIKQTVNSAGGKISFEAIQLLINFTENNLWQIENELNKLINYKSADVAKEITVKDVRELAKGHFDENIFALTDALSTKNRSLAAKLLSDQYDAGLSDSYILSMFLRQFKILIQIRQALDFGANSRKIITDLKLHPFIVQKGINQARNFNTLSLKKIINHLVAIEAGMKTGKTNCRAELDLLISKI